MKLGVFCIGGANKLKVFSDFDHTLTPLYRNGGRAKVSYGVLEDSLFLDSRYKHENELLYQKYYLIEKDPNLSVKEKTPHMIKWWRRAHDLLIKFQMKKKYIPEMVRAANIGLRSGVVELFDCLSYKNVPVAIVSAGIGDIILEVLRQHYPRFNEHKFHLVSNRMTFSEEGDLVGWSGMLVHTFNKKNQLQEHEENPERSNLLVLGDHDYDAFVASRIYADAQIKIGFLNDVSSPSDPRVAKYLQHYDVVILDDGNCDFILDLVNTICE